MARQSTEKYREQGLVQLSTWITPETMRKIKTLSILEEKSIQDIVEEKFADFNIELEKNSKRLVIKFKRELETQDS